MREFDPQAAEVQVSDWRTFYGCLLAALVFGCLLGMLLPSLNISPWAAIALWVFAVGLSAFFLRMIFPKVVHVDRPMRFEVIVDRIVEKRVEVPVEREVEVRVEVEVPVVKYVSKDVLNDDGRPSYVLSADAEAMWRQIEIGMTRHEVIAILGKPDGPPQEERNCLGYYWDMGFVQFQFHAHDKQFKVCYVSMPKY